MNQKAMLQGQEAKVQSVSRIVCTHLNASLADDRTAIQRGSHEMDAGTMLPVTGFECFPVRIQAPMSGQQRGVDVDHLAATTVDKICAENAHEARQNHVSGRKALDCRIQAGLKLSSVRVSAAIDADSVEPVFGSPGQSCGIRVIADRCPDRFWQNTVLSGPCQRRQVAAAARNQNHEPGWLIHGRKRIRESPPFASTTRPMS